MITGRTAGRALAATIMMGAVLAVTAAPAYAIGTLSVADATIAEGTGGSTTMTFVVSLSTANVLPVTVGYATSDGSAAAASDYTAVSGTLTIPAGATSANIAVPLVTDAFPEPNEALTLTLSTPSTGTSIGDGSAIGTIANDDGLPPALTIDDPATTETDAAGSVAFTVSLPGPATQDTTVGYATASGTAASGVDFGAVSGTATIAAGDVSVVVPVTIVGDQLDEADESFSVTLSTPTNATIADGTGTATIVDDDDVPAALADAPAVGETDGATALSFTVTLDAPSGRTAAVDYATSDGTATVGVDYTSVSGTLVFAPGDVSETVMVPVLGDDVDEPDETVTLTLSSAVNAVISQPTSTGTIVDDEPAPALSIADLTVTEGDSGTSSAEVLVTLSAASGQTVTVHAATTDTGTASAGTDYEAAQADITFPAGATSRTFTVPVLGDLLDESNETVALVLDNEGGAVIADGSATLTVSDDDATPTLSLTDATLAEGDAGNVPATLTLTLSAPSGRDVSVMVSTSNGTATGGADFAAQNGTVIQIPAGATTAPVPFTVFGDVIDEADEIFALNLAGATNAGIADGTGTITILDDDTGPSISIDDVTQLEGTGSAATDTVFTFTVALSAPSEQTVTVAYSTANASAAAGVTGDYDAKSGTVVFTPGQQSRPITVNVNRDAHAEPSEAFIVELSAPASALLSGDATGTGTILNDDGPPAAISIADVSVAEGAGAASVTVTLSKAVTQEVTVDVVSSNGTATTPADYGSVAATISFSAGQTSTSTDVAIADDPIDEQDEAFTLTLSNARNGVVADGTATVTVADDDATPSLSISDSSVTEGSTAHVTVSLSGPSSQTITVQVSTADGTATAGDDYTAIAAELSLAPGETSAVVPVATAADVVAEGDETLTLSLSSPTGDATIADGAGVGTIHDDDAAGTFTPLAPTRLLDTRIGLGRSGTSQVAGGQTVALHVTGAGGVPAAGVAAIVLNVTVTGPTGPGFVSVTPTGGSSTSNLNFATHEDVANLVMVPVAPDGSVRLFTSQTTHLIADVFGWFASDAVTTPGSHFTDVQPARLLDTRSGVGVPGGGSTPITGGVTQVLDVTGVGGVPTSGVTAVILNVTVTQPTAASFLSVTPMGGTTTSNINFSASETAAGLVVVPVGSDGMVRFAVGSGTTHVIADVFGWFATPGSLTGSVLTAVDPARLLDTRSDPGGPLGPDEAGLLTIAGEGGVPVDGVDAAVLNLTATQPTAPGYLAATPDGEPGTSNLNFGAGQTVANLAVVPVHPDGDVVIYNNAGQVHVLVDVFAWFSTPAT